MPPLRRNRRGRGGRRGGGGRGRGGVNWSTQKKDLPPHEHSWLSPPKAQHLGQYSVCSHCKTFNLLTSSPIPAKKINNKLPLKQFIEGIRSWDNTRSLQYLLCSWKDLLCVCIRSWDNTRSLQYLLCSW